jgi:hypothetical protein
MLRNTWCLQAIIYLPQGMYAEYTGKTKRKALIKPFFLFYIARNNINPG